MTAAWESPVLGHVTTEPRMPAEDVAAGWAPGAEEALELCSTWTGDRAVAH